MKKSTLILICLGVLAIISAGAPSLGMLAAITVIGLPIAVLYWAFPALFLVYLIAYCIYHLLPVRGVIAGGVALVITLILLGIPPLLLNGSMENLARSYVANDKDMANAPLNVETIAVRQNLRFFRQRDDYTLCDGFCLHALLSGAASNVVIHHTKTPHAPLDVSAEGTLYRLERRASCPEVKFRDRRSKFKLETNLPKDEKAPNPIELMKLRISNGECLVSETVPLDRADVIISRGSPLEKKHKSNSDGFLPAVTLRRVERFTVHTKAQSTGDFVEDYRFTQVQYRPLLPVLLPVPEFYAELRTEMTWGRLEDSINITDKYYQGPDWPGFLTGTLGLDLTLKNENLDDKVGEKIAAAIGAGRKPTPAEWQLIEAYYEGLFLGRRADIKTADYDNAVRLLRAPDFPPVPRFYGVTKHVSSKRSSQEVTNLVDGLLGKLEMGPTWDNALGYEFDEAVRDLGNSVRWIPDDAFLPFFDRHLALARDARIQQSIPFVTKLHVHGPQAGPVLLEAMKTGLAGGEYFFRKNEFQHPYLGGLKGLCEGGRSVNSVLPELLQLAEAGDLPNHASYGDLLASTLVRLGADKETVWKLYSQWEPERRTRDRFAKLVERAERDRNPDCSY